MAQQTVKQDVYGTTNSQTGRVWHRKQSNRTCMAPQTVKQDVFGTTNSQTGRVWHNK